MRPSGRKLNELRDLKIEINHNNYADGSCLISLGNTKISCTASLEEKTPKWIKSSGNGWVTAEYAMLPRATASRNEREARKGSQTGRTQEIQRFIGRSLRSVVDLKFLSGKQIIIDCDVLMADGGTRTLSVTGGYVALHIALLKMVQEKQISQMPILSEVAAISCGIYKGSPIIDLDYLEDSDADADANFVFTSKGEIVEIQGTADRVPFSADMFNQLLSMAQAGVKIIFDSQRKALDSLK